MARRPHLAAGVGLCVVQQLGQHLRRHLFRVDKAAPDGAALEDHLALAVLRHLRMHVRVRLMLVSTTLR